ncbi:MAG: 2-succinyl-5-enolpyruvyl-6-hydroxy-3-cyclohexene-1-carboxylic-acid synthase [Weeksellaceae bacterium]|nr:2-succinyl-5-enolpyruvyl-6-hydroxy-3-cyclohexene-1-carboxylic-acid synthase [Weeksellaceae bacterium]
MKKFSKKLNVQLIAEVFKGFGIEHIVLSPGSRNGALATHFYHHPSFKTYSIVDERSAGFVALGMAQQTRKPVVLCCTSGSALANYYPAVTEAFYQNVPLLILSADRPAHLVDNFDGQTIRQENLLEKHTYDNVQLDEDESTESLTFNLGLIKKAIGNCIKNSGPVHINMPFSEPLYEFQSTLAIDFEEFKTPVFKQEKIQIVNFIEKWNQADKKLILVGMQFPDEKLNRQLKELAKDESVVVLTETTSNVHSERFINKIDSVIFSLSEEELEELKPEILLTIGQNVVSKKIKAFFRQHKPQEHWHLDTYWQPDTFQCLTEKIPVQPNVFLTDFLPNIQFKKTDYFQKWSEIRQKKEQKQAEFAQKTPFSDFKIFERLIQTYPKGIQVHYSNSSVIRYAQLFTHSPEITVFCNRGASGIDGCSSTAVGASMVNKTPTLLVSGDIGFFYDSNALWNNYLPENFRIVLINNGGGNIFKIIPGPENSGVMEEVFETQHNLNAEFLAKMFQFEYTKVNSLDEFESEIKEFYQTSKRPKIMEINTFSVENAEIQRAYFKIK